MGKNEFTHIDRNHVDLGMSVLSSLGSRHVNNFAGPSLDHDMTTEWGEMASGSNNIAQDKNRQIQSAQPIGFKQAEAKRRGSTQFQELTSSSKRCIAWGK